MTFWDKVGTVLVTALIAAFWSFMLLGAAVLVMWGHN
jgi:hypothetical protein